MHPHEYLEAWHLLRELELAGACGHPKAAVFAVWFHDWILHMALHAEG
jgi:hypothetical protein